MSQSAKSLFSGSIWGVIAKILDAAAKFLTIPLLVGFYGKADYGLIALAFSLNAYLRLMDMGTNVGAIRFFSIWVAQKEWGMISKVSQSGIVFYGILGTINAIIFLIVGNYSDHFFNLSAHQVPIFKSMMLVLAVSTILNWLSNVVVQLLSANGEVGWINKVSIISSVLNFATAFIAIKLHISLNFYFLLFTLSTLAIIPVNVYRLKVYNMPVKDLLSPKWYWKEFKVTLSYSLGMFVMSIFQFSADNLRPILLTKFSSQGVTVLTEYRVIQTISALVIAFAGVFMQVLLPSASKAFAEKDTEKINKLAYRGTKYIALFLAFVIFMLVCNSNLILTLYMGAGYTRLSVWLIIWLLSLLGLHNSTIASIVLSTGKTRSLVFMSAISCMLSLPITVIFAKQYDVGAAVLGYLVYVLLQLAFYYFYYIPRTLSLSALRIFFVSFMPAVIIGCAGWAGIYFFNLYIIIKSHFINLVINSAMFSVIFLALMLLFILKPKEIMNVRGSIVGK